MSRRHSLGKGWAGHQLPRARGEGKAGMGKAKLPAVSSATLSPHLHQPHWQESCWASPAQIGSHRARLASICCAPWVPLSPGHPRILLLSCEVPEPLDMTKAGFDASSSSLPVRTVSHGRRTRRSFHWRKLLLPSRRGRRAVAWPSRHGTQLSPPQAAHPVPNEPPAALCG